MKFENKMEAVMAQYKQVCKDMQKKAKQIKIIFLFTEFSVFAFAIQYV